jgi:magnesium transporter
MRMPSVAPGEGPARSLGSGEAMIIYYTPVDGRLERHEPGPAVGPLPREAVWIDLVAPTGEDDARSEALVGIEVPAREDMQEIEPSSRLYVENGAVYMTATLLCGLLEGRPGTTPVTFILAGGRLVTVRYDEPKSFPIAASRMQKASSHCMSGQAAFLSLFDAVIDRTADILEHIAADVDAISRTVFDQSLSDRRGGPDFHAVIRRIGGQGMLTNRATESLTSQSRLLLFLTQHAETAGFSTSDHETFKTMTRDVKALTDHASALDSKINFLLDAVLGLVNLDQSAIVKIFSVLAVVFMPPTLIASIYGMNFQMMPELDWRLGYPFALFLMAGSAALSYGLFRWKRWL